MRKGRLKLGISTLRRTSLRQYLATEEDDGNLWLFFHIPKTAGSFLGTEIPRELRPYCNIHVEYDDNRFVCLGSAANDMRRVGNLALLRHGALLERRPLFNPKADMGADCELGQLAGSQPNSSMPQSAR